MIDIFLPLIAELNKKYEKNSMISGDLSQNIPVG